MIAQTLGDPGIWIASQATGITSHGIEPTGGGGGRNCALSFSEEREFLRPVVDPPDHYPADVPTCLAEFLLQRD
jgi:hypothetical protein